MTLYVINDGFYNYEIFSTEDKAIAYMEKHYGDDYYINEMELDPEG